MHTCRAWCISIAVSFASISGVHAADLSAATQDEFLPVDQAFQMQAAIKGTEVNVHWQVAPGYYLYRSRIKLGTRSDDVKLATPKFSDDGELKNDPNFGPQRVFHNGVNLNSSIIAAPAGVQQIQVRYQGCAEAGLCYPPQTRNVPLLFAKSVVPNEAKDSDTVFSTPDGDRELSGDDVDGLSRFLQKASWPLIITTFFVLGLGLTFTPCVLPMIPILSGIIVGQQPPPSTPRAFTLSVGYVLGMATTYASLGVVVGYFGARANIQAWMQQPLVLVVFSLLFVLLALAMFGFYELQLPAAIRDRLDRLNQRESGGQVLGVVVMGILSALVVSPCVSAPLAGALLYISSTGNALLGGSALFALALGMGLPLIIIGTTGASILPKAGVWMERVKQAFGIILLGIALWLLQRVLPEALTLALWSILFIAIGVHLGALHGGHENHSGWRRSSQALGLAVLMWGVFTLWGAAQGGGGSLGQPLANSFAPSSQNTATTLNPIIKVKSAAQLNDLLSAGAPLVVDIYADWCVSCRTMEEEIFSQQDVMAMNDSLQIVQLDVTAFNSGHKELLNRLHLAGPPAILFFGPDGEEIESSRLLGEVSHERFVTSAKRYALPYVNIAEKSW